MYAKIIMFFVYVCTGSRYESEKVLLYVYFGMVNIFFYLMQIETFVIEIWYFLIFAIINGNHI